VQQGMNGERRQARRYHWSSEHLGSFVDAPHTAIEGPSMGNIVNLADRRAQCSRDAQVSLLQELGPAAIAREFVKLADAAPHPSRRAKPPEVAPGPIQLGLLPHLTLPDRHDVRGSDVVMRRLHGNLAAAAECGPRDFTELLQVPGVGARTVRALALVAEVLHGTPCRFTDPARFSFAHGGKDRQPFPVPTRVYDQTIRVLRQAVGQARLGREEQLAALRRLDDQSRRLERHVRGPGVDELSADELRQSHAFGGRSVFGWEPPPQSDLTGDLDITLDDDQPVEHAAR
jgi:hypothetical protein